MSDPRTVAEFAAGGWRVVLLCRCGGHDDVPPDVLSATFGDDFDLRGGGVAEISSQLHCGRCGAHRPVVDFVAPNASAMEAEGESPSRALGWR